MLLALLQLAYWLGVRRYFVSLEEAILPVARLTHERVVAFPSGGFGVDGLGFAVNARQELALGADRLRAHGVDPAWLVRWLLGFETAIPDRLMLEVEGVRATPALLGALRARSGGAGLMLPFEGFGCHDDPLLLDADYETLGWSSPRFDLNLSMRRDRVRGGLTIDARIDRAPAGVARLVVAFADVPEAGIPLRADLGGARLLRLTIDYDEQGALTERNGYCASMVAEKEKDFVTEHLRHLHAWFGGHGLVPDEPIWAAYREWLGEGGPVRLEMAPAQVVAFEDYPQFSPPDRLRLLGIDLRLGQGDPVRVEATAVRQGQQAFRPLPSLEVVDQAEVPQLRMLHAGIPDASAFDEIDEMNESTLSSSEADVPPALPPAIVKPARPLAPTNEPSFTPIEFPELTVHRGRWVRISTINGNRYRGLVLDATADAVELEIRRYSGGARLPIPRDQISQIDLMSVAVLDRG